MSLSVQCFDSAASTLVPEHFNEIAGRRIAHVDKTLAAVHERLTKEIDFWSDRFIKLSDDKAAGMEVRLYLENVRHMLTCQITSAFGCALP